MGSWALVLLTACHLRRLHSPACSLNCTLFQSIAPCRVDSIVGEPVDTQPHAAAPFAAAALLAAAPLDFALPDSQRQLAQESQELLAQLQRLSVGEELPAAYVPDRGLAQGLLWDALAASEPRTVRQLAAEVQQRTGVQSALGSQRLAYMVRGAPGRMHHWRGCGLVTALCT